MRYCLPWALERPYNRQEDSFSTPNSHPCVPISSYLHPLTNNKIYINRTTSFLFIQAIKNTTTTYTLIKGRSILFVLRFWEIMASQQHFNAGENHAQAQVRLWWRFSAALVDFGHPKRKKKNFFFIVSLINWVIWMNEWNADEVRTNNEFSKGLYKRSCR